MENLKDTKGLVEKLKEEGILRTPNIIKAVEKVDRLDFVIEYLKDDAYLNAPLGIGFGQTISQPLTVAFMLELLQPKNGDKILDIGFGSGWQTAILSEIVSPDGEVHSIEIIPEIFEFGKENLKKLGFLDKNIIKLYNQDAHNGIPNESPFDKIISAAAPQEGIPQEWKKQLSIGGRLVFPMEDSLWLLEKKSEDEFIEKKYPGFVFVPLVRKNIDNGS